MLNIKAYQTTLPLRPGPTIGSRTFRTLGTRYCDAMDITRRGRVQNSVLVRRPWVLCFGSTNSGPHSPPIGHFNTGFWLWHWNVGCIFGNGIASLHRWAFSDAQIPVLDVGKSVQVNFLPFKARNPRPACHVCN